MSAAVGDEMNPGEGKNLAEEKVDKSGRGGINTQAGRVCLLVSFSPSMDAILACLVTILIQLVSANQ